MYRRGAVDDNDWHQQEQTTHKFLNSGCIAGRVAQLRHMYTYTQEYAALVRDDQQILVRYLLQHPDMASVDTQHDMFVTTHKAVFVLGNMDIGIDLTYYYTSWFEDALHNARGTNLKGTEGHPIGLIHCNNKKNNGLYTHFSNQLLALYRDHYSGPDGKGLLRAVHLMRDGQPAAAREALGRPEVRRNLTSRGGHNAAGDHLMALLDDKDY